MLSLLYARLKSVVTVVMVVWSWGRAQGKRGDRRQGGGEDAERGKGREGCGGTSAGKGE